MAEILSKRVQAVLGNNGAQTKYSLLKHVFAFYFYFIAIFICLIAHKLNQYH